MSDEPTPIVWVRRHWWMPSHLWWRQVDKLLAICDDRHGFDADDKRVIIYQHPYRRIPTQPPGSSA